MSLSVDIKKDLGTFKLSVSFENSGSVLGLLGASGCGKTMTLKCIAGIVRPDEGRIVLNGKVLFDSSRHIDLPPQKRQVGYLFQNYGLFPNMTVEQNILCGLCREKNASLRREAVQDIIKRMMLTGLEKHRPDQLSGGQQQRVALARILVGDPQILMLDEPFSALDSNLRTRMQTEMKETLESFGRDAILVTHNRSEAYTLCSDIAVMDSGRILNRDDARSVFRDPGSIAAASLTGCKNIAAAVKTGPRELRVPQWNLSFIAGQDIRDGLKAIGIRAHYFDPREQANNYKVVYCGKIEQPFEMIVKFRYAGSDSSSEELWWRIPKDRLPESMPDRLGISEENIMLLY